MTDSTNDNAMQNGYFRELKRLLDASKGGVFDTTLDSEGLSGNEAEAVRILNEVIGNYKAAMEFNTMKYMLASDALGIAHWDMDFVSDDPGNRNSRLIWSQEVRELIGFSDEKDFPNLLSSLTDRIHPEDRESAIKEFTDHIAGITGEKPFDVRYRLMMKSGEYRRFRSFGKTLRDGEGNPLRVAGAIEDIEDKTRMQESLIKAEKEKVELSNLENILNGLNAMICVTDPETDELLFINSSMKDAFGAGDDCIGQKCHKVLRGFDERCDFCPCIRLEAAPDKEYVWEQVNPHNNRIYHYISSFLKWPNGKTVHIQNAIDITDVKEAERDIAEKNEFNQILFDNAPVGLTVFDKDYKFVACNDNVLKMFGGITREFYSEFFGSSEHSPEFQPDGLSSREKAMSLINKVIGTGETIKTEFVHRKPDGSPLPVELTLTRIKQDDDYVGLGFIYDMSEQTELKEQLKKALYEAESANKAKSDFLAKMSHEIRTPMNAILGITEIQMRSGELSPDTEEALGKIYESGTMLMGIINDILDLSKIEADKLEIITVEYDILSMVNDTAQLNRMRCNSELIEFDVRLDENTPQHLFGDELRIKQILNNILSNAFKYTDRGRIEFAVSAEMIDNDNATAADDDAPDTMLIIRVTDTGQGMSKDQLELLFTDYTRFNLETNRTTSGTGLGLSITKRLTDLMGGELVVDSEVGKGSVFTVRLPQKRHGDEVCGAELVERLRNVRFHSTSLAKKTQFVREFMPYGNVLVVDDVESNLYVAKGMLLPYGLQIDTAANGFEVLSKVESGKVYDIIFMDYMMPKMDGVETTKKVREAGYKAPIIALTANALVGQAEMFLRNGFDAIISKPIDSRELNHSLTEFIRNRKPREVVEAARREQAAKNEKRTSKRRDKQELETPSFISDPSVFEEMKKLLKGDAKRAVDVLDGLYGNIKNLSDEELESYIVTVHGMKSALNNVGKTDMASAALRLELAGNECDFDVIAKETRAFIDALSDLIDELDPQKDAQADVASGGSTGSEDDLALLNEKLSEIKTQCESYNVSAARALLGELTSMSWSQPVSAVLDEINIHLLHSDFDEAVKVIDVYL